VQDVPIFKTVGGTAIASKPAAQLSGGALQNYPQCTRPLNTRLVGDRLRCCFTIEHWIKR